MSINAFMTAAEQQTPEMVSAALPVLKNRLGLKQLQDVHDRTGIPNYATGRALSPSTFKKYMINPLGYLEAMAEPQQTRQQRANQWYDKSKRHFMLGDLLQDYLRMGEEKAVSTKYHVFAGKSIDATTRTIAELRKKKAITINDHELVKQMCSRIEEKAPDYLEKLRQCNHEEDRTIITEVAGQEMAIRGIADAVQLGMFGNDIKSIDSLSMIDQRILAPYYKSIQYWLQPAIYGKLWNLKQFDFLFINKKPHSFGAIVTFDEQTLGNMWTYLSENWLTSYLWHLENGFEKQAPQDFRKRLPSFKYYMKLL